MIQRRILSATIAAVAMLAIAACQTDGPSSPIAQDEVMLKYGEPGGGGGGGGGGGPPSGGGEDTGPGNNLSNPVYFAEAVGITGVPIASLTDYANTGLRPLTTEVLPYADLLTVGVPFFFSGNVADAAGCFMQKTANSWQPEWALGTPGVDRAARIDWGDNLGSVQWTTNSVIRVEHTLFDDATILTGYVMDPSCTLNPQSPDEMQGTKGATAQFAATIYSVVARLTIQKVDTAGGEPIPGTVAFDGAVSEGFAADGPGFYGAEINVGGKLIYGYNLNMKRVDLGSTVAKDGWWRIAFQLEATAALPGGAIITRGVKMTTLDPLDLTEEKVFKPQLSADGYTSYMDIYLGTNRGGKGGSKSRRPTS